MADSVARLAKLSPAHEVAIRNLIIRIPTKKLLYHAAAPEWQNVLFESEVFDQRLSAKVIKTVDVVRLLALPLSICAHDTMLFLVLSNLARFLVSFPMHDALLLLATELRRRERFQPSN